MTSNTEMVTIFRAEYEQLILKKKKIFGTFSGQLDQMVMDQFAHLFNKAEGWDQASYEPAIKVKSHTRKRRTGSVEDVIPEGTPVEVVEHHLPEEDRICAACGANTLESGEEVRRTLQMEPARFWVREPVLHLRLQELRAGDRRDGCGVRIQSPLCAAREFCIPFCHCLYCHPEICDLLSTVPTGVRI